MKIYRILLVNCLIFATHATLLSADPKAETSHQAQIEQGRYLVHQVAMCIDCHSPRGEDGAFVEDLHLTGSPLPFAATVPMPWASLAPRIAGLPDYYDREAMITFLTTGQRPNGMPPVLPPMPTFRLSVDDATAITAYLLSLKADS